MLSYFEGGKVQTNQEHNLERVPWPWLLTADALHAASYTRNMKNFYTMCTSQLYHAPDSNPWTV